MNCRRPYLLLRNLSIGVLWLGCSTCSTQAEQPSEVVRRYSRLVSSGQFDEAKTLCTPAGQAFIDALQGVIESTSDSLQGEPNQIQQLSCSTTDSTAYCTSTEYDGFETYKAEYHLTKTPTGWLVDYLNTPGNTSNMEEIIEQKD